MNHSTSDRQFILKRDNEEIRLRSTQVSARNISRHFHVDQETVYLKATFGSALEFPNANGDFDLNHPEGSAFNVVCDGDEMSSSNQSNRTGLQLSRTPVRNRGSRPVLATVKVVRADLGSNGEPTNFDIHNLTIHINIYCEEQSCINYLTTKVCSEMGDPNLILVGPNGMVYDDQEGTRGIPFWKIGSRKLFAVPERMVEEHQTRIEEVEGNEIGHPPIKRRRSNLDNEEMQRSMGKLLEEMKKFNAEVKKFRNFAFRHKLSASFRLELEDAFSCIICKEVPARKPLVVCIDCNSLIGCQSCVDQWYGGPQGLQKKCPKCRCERGLTKTTVLKGFDKLLEQVKNLREHSLSDEIEDEGHHDDNTHCSVI